MAVQQWELDLDLLHRAPRLELVPTLPLGSRPRGGRVLPALLFVALLVGTLGYPVIRAATQAPPKSIAWSPRPLPLSAIATLDPVRPMGVTTRPASSEPLGGILFVSCTNLWTSLPDGSHPRKLLQFPGASSPAFSPDARTIAFVGPGEAGATLYMVGADGGGLTAVGPFSSDGVPVRARVTNLSWSQNSDKMIFSLVDPAYDPWLDGSSIWILDVLTGEFKRVGGGSPSPAFVAGRPAFASSVKSTKPGAGTSFTGAPMAKRLSTPGNDVSFGVAPDRFSDSWSTNHGVVVLHEAPSGDLELAVKTQPWVRKVRATFDAPSPYSFMASGRVSVSQDARRAVVDLRDPKGDRAMGLIDLATGEWTVRDYAWSGTATPALTSSGPLGSQRVQRLAGDVFGNLGGKRPYNAAALMVVEEDEALLDNRRGGYVLGPPVRAGRGWSVPATLYSRRHGRYRFQRARLETTTTDDGRIEGVIRAVSPALPLRTIDDAKRFLSEVVGEDLPMIWPSYLPVGAELDPQWPVDAYTYDDQSVATIHLTFPTGDKSELRSMSISYGDVNFGLGCGGVVNPQQTEVGGQAGLFDQTGTRATDTRQVLWPATLDRRDTGMYSVFGQMPREELERIAESMSDQG